MRAALFYFVACTALGLGTGQAQASIPTAPDARTAAAVQAADDAWGTAETSGDADYVDWLLLPGYRSIGKAGSTTDKMAIVARTRQNKGSAAQAAAVAAWKAAHPIKAKVTLFGDTAVLNWVSADDRSTESVFSCDIFVYRDGHWHAIYSQHTAA
jgi:hypothetical protein